MKVLLVGDSFGVERVHGGVVDVREDQTWPSIVKNAYKKASVEFTTDFKVYRRLVDCVEVVKEFNEHFDLIILEAGIVDSFKRPLNLKWSKSKSFHYKIVRRLVRAIRKEWMLYLNSVQWSSWGEIDQSINEISKHCDNLILLSCCPITQQQAIDSPGAQENLFKFNTLIQDIADRKKNIETIRLDLKFLETDYETFIHPVDSHLNVKGNATTADMVLEKLKSFVSLS